MLKDPISPKKVWWRSLVLGSSGCTQPLLATTPVAARKPRPVATLRSPESCTSMPLGLQQGSNRGQCTPPFFGSEHKHKHVFALWLIFQLFLKLVMLQKMFRIDSAIINPRSTFPNTANLNILHLGIAYSTNVSSSGAHPHFSIFPARYTIVWTVSIETVMKR